MIRSPKACGFTRGMTLRSSAIRTQSRTRDLTTHGSVIKNSMPTGTPIAAVLVGLETPPGTVMAGSPSTTLR
jgi:hypothetical protein